MTHHRGEIGGVERDWINAANALGPDRIRLTWAGIEGTRGLADHVDSGVLRGTLDAGLPLFAYLVHEKQYVRRSSWLWLKIVVDHLWRSLGPLRSMRVQLRGSRFDLVLSGTSVVTGGAFFAGTRRLPHVWAVKEWLDPSVSCSRRYAAALSAMSTSVIVPSQSVAEIFGTRATVIPDGTDMEALEGQGADRDAVLRSLSLPPDRPLVAQCGTICWWKGQHVMLEAVDSIARRSPSALFSLLFLGSGSPEDLEELRARVDRLPPAWRGAVRFASFPPGNVRYLRAADVIVHPSVLPDPFPNAVRESLLLGKPVIATKVGGIPEMIVDGRTGMLVEPGDADSLGKAVLRVLDDGELRTALGLGALREAPAVLSSRATSGRLYDALCAAVGS